MKTRFNLQNFKAHLTYNWWKYILSAVLIAFGVSLLFTVTRYTVPEDKKVEVYVYGYTADEALSEYLNGVREDLLPEMEEISFQTLMQDETYGDMVLQVRMMAGEGDIYILPRDQFFGYSNNGFMVALEDYPEVTGFIEEKQLSVQTGWRSTEDDPTVHLFGIPISQLPSLQQYVYSEDGYLSVYVANGNEENVRTFLIRFLEDMAEPLPEAEETVTETVSAE